MHSPETGIVRKRHDAEDILQDVFIQIYRKLKYLDEPRAYRAWVYRIAWRLAHRFLKRARQICGISFDESALDETLNAPSPHTLDSELVDRIHAQIEQLPPNTRAVLLLHYCEELTIREVADVLGLPDGTIKSRLAYGLALLRERVQEE